MSRPREWPPAWSRLADAYGGIDALAAKLETSRDVVARWARGSTMLGPARVAVRAVSRDAGVRSPV